MMDQDTIDNFILYFWHMGRNHRGTDYVAVCTSGCRASAKISRLTVGD